MSTSSARLQSLIVKDLLGSIDILKTDQRLAFAAEALSQSVVKKFEPHDDDDSRSRAAIAKFLEVNQSISESFANDNEDPLVRSAIARAKDRLGRHFPCERFYEPDPRNGKFGPGSSAEISFNDPYGKLDEWSYSTTAVLAFFLRGGYADTLDRKALARRIEKQHKKTISRLTTVPKNDKIDRTIAVEPSLNMYLQQAIRFDLESILQTAYGLDLSTQQLKQKRLAYIGSLQGRYATIDLSSASDSIGLSFCEWFLPPDLFFWLKEARCGQVEVGDQIVDLRMVSTMGNATTFPLQTMIFASLVLGCYECLGLKASSSSRYFYGRDDVSAYGVFGDDIIVVAEAYELVTKVLKACGFTPNPAKSFNTGFFRESCGGDYYFGYPCRGVYVTSLKTTQDVYSAINRIRRWSVFHGLPLRKTLSYLTSLAAKLERKSGGHLRRVPIWMPDDSGVHDECGSGRYKAWLPRQRYRTVSWYDSDIAWLTLQFGGLSACTDNYLRVGVRDPDGKTPYRTKKGISFNWDNPRVHVTTWDLPGPNGVPFSFEWHVARLGPEICHLGA